MDKFVYCHQENHSKNTYPHWQEVMNLVENRFINEYFPKETRMLTHDENFVEIHDDNKS